MAHPKGKTSKTRRDKRRAHHGLSTPQIAICKTTGEAHKMHRSYWHEGNMYYKGQIVVKAGDKYLDE